MNVVAKKQKEMIPIRKVNELKAGTMIAYVMLAVGFIVPLFYTPIMLDLLGQEEYGLFSLSNSVIGYLSLLGFGMSSTLARYAATYRATKTKDDLCRLIGLFFTIYIVVGVLVLIVGAVLLFFVGDLFGQGLTAAEIEKMRSLLVIMTINTAITFPFSVFPAVITAYEKYIFPKIVSLIETIAAPVLNLIILYAGFRSVGMAIGTLCISVANSLLYAVYCAKKLGVYPRFRHMPFGILKEILSFSFFVFVSSIVDMLYWATDKVLLGAMVGTVAVAVYNVGGTFNTILQKMSSAISGVFVPRITMMVANNASPAQLSEQMIRIGRLQYLIISLILSGFAVFGQTFLLYWAGEGYGDAYYIALLTMVTLSIPLVQNLAFSVLLAKNKHQFRSIVYAVIAVINVVSTYLVIPYFGVIGAAVCTAVSFILGQGIIMNIYYHKVIGLNIPLFWKNIAKMSVVPALLIMGGLLFFHYVLPITSLSMMLLCAFIFTVLFVLLSWFITMNAYEKGLFRGFIQKFFHLVQKLLRLKPAEHN